jgi:Ca2+-binding RTX toxin-like protein
MAYIVGTNNDETLPGSTGNDDMYALGGNDVLVSSGGYDTMSGGYGYDTFKFNSVSEAYYDRIDDFQHGWDAIDVSAIDAKEYSWSSPSTWGNNSFTFKGNIAGAALGKGELGFQYMNGDTMIFGNTDGDGSYELAFRVTGYHYFSAAEFVL